VSRDGHDSGKCRGCGAPILWVRTAKDDRPVPLDPVAFRGVVLTRKEASELKGSPDLRRGYNRDGFVVAIRVIGQGGLFDAAIPDEDLETVWETHFATCPRRKAFRRVQARRRELAARRRPS